MKEMEETFNKVKDICKVKTYKEMVEVLLECSKGIKDNFSKDSAVYLIYIYMLSVTNGKVNPAL